MFQYSMTYTLAQQDAPPPPSAQPAAPGTPGTTPAPGQTTTAPTGEQQAVPPAGPMGSNFMWLMILMVVFLWVMMFLPQRRERKRRQEMLGALKKGDKIQTIGGILGTVLDVKEHEVVLKVDEANNTKLRFTRAAIQTVLPDGKPAEDTK